MRRLLPLALVVLVLVFIGAYLWFAVTSGRSMIRSQADSVELLDQMQVHCPPDTTRTGRPHGKAGWAISCEREGVRHGPWLKAEAGRLEIRGQYCMGTPCGEWQWFGHDGAVFKQKTYPSPVEAPPGPTDR
jgi:hypothetical protein